MAFVPYQVDYQVTSKGKTLGVSKKKVTFKFGFANPEALAEGVVGSNCRGAEHEMVFIWSLNSGKRQLTVDGKEVHYSESGANGWTGDRNFQHIFNLRTPGFGPVRCHFVTTPAQQAPNRRPYDLRINGVSYFDCPKIYQLGTAAMMARPLPEAPAPGGHDPEVDPYATPEERRLIAQAKLESLRDLKSSQEGPPAAAAAPKQQVMPREEVSLIDFGGEEETAPAAVVGGTAVPQVSQLTIDPAISGSDSNIQGYPSPTGGAPPYGQQQQQQPYSYGQPPPPSPFGQPQQPPSPQKQQQQYLTQYAPASSSVPPSGTASNAMTQWQPAPGTAPPQHQYGNVLPPIASGSGSWASGVPSQNHSAAAARPPATSWGGPPAGGPPPAGSTAGQFQSPPPPTQADIQNAFSPSYGQQPQQQQQQQQPPAFASPQSYGSAPSFAQPPQQQQQQVPVVSSSASTMTYGSAAPSFAHPPQQQQYPTAGYTGY